MRCMLTMMWHSSQRLAVHLEPEQVVLLIILQVLVGVHQASSYQFCPWCLHYQILSCQSCEGCLSVTQLVLTSQQREERQLLLAKWFAHGIPKAISRGNLNQKDRNWQDNAVHNGVTMALFWHSEGSFSTT